MTRTEQTETEIKWFTPCGMRSVGRHGTLNGYSLKWAFVAILFATLLLSLAYLIVLAFYCDVLLNVLHANILVSMA